VIGRVGYDDLGRQVLDQGIALRCIALLTCGECEADRTAETAHGHVDLGAQAPTGAAKGLIFSPFFAPAACWWARMLVLATIRYSKSGSSDIADKMRHRTPLRLQRLKRPKTLFHSPNTSGRSRQGEPVRTIHNTASTTMRLSRPDDPRVRSSPIICCDIRSH